MTSLSLLITKTAKALFQNLRGATYDDMAHQASDWIPEEARRKPAAREKRPIKLDFSAPKRRRLAWIRRAVQHPPH